MILYEDQDEGVVKNTKICYTYAVYRQRWEPVVLMVDIIIVSNRVSEFKIVFSSRPYLPVWMS